MAYGKMRGVIKKAVKKAKSIKKIAKSPSKAKKVPSKGSKGKGMIQRVIAKSRGKAGGKARTGGVKKARAMSGDRRPASQRKAMTRGRLGRVAAKMRGRKRGK